MNPQGARPENAPGLGEMLKMLSQFDRAWKAGAAPRIEEFLARINAAAARRELLEELIKVSLEHRLG